MSITSIVLLAVLGIGGLGMVAGLPASGGQMIASRWMRVGLAVLTVPVILFCGFGFLASFEGSDPVFIAFRIGYGTVAALLGGVALFLAFGRIKPGGSDGAR